MQDIHELVLLLQQHAPQVWQQPGTTTNLNPVIAQLCERLRLGHYQSESEVLTDLFPGAGPDSLEYKALIAELRGYLVGQITAFNSRLEGSGDYQYVYRETHKQWLVVRFLQGNNAGTLALPLAKQLLAIAEKFGFTQLCIDIYAFLRIQYCLSSHYDAAQCKAATRQHQYFRRIYAAEYLAEERYTEINTLAAIGELTQKKISRLAGEAYEQIEADLNRYKTYKLCLYGYLLKVQELMSSNVHQDVLQCCANAIRFFKSKPFDARVPLQIFYYMQLISNIQLRQLAPGIKSATFCLDQVEEGSFNWFKFKELALRLMLHTGKYTKALDIYNEVSQHSKMADFPEVNKETWVLFQYYLDLLYRHGDVGIAPFGSLRKRPFSSEMEVYSKRETGMYTAWNVLTWFRLLEQREFDRLGELSDDLHAYSKQYLKRAISRRSYQFLELLAATSKANFELRAMEALERVFLPQIQKMPAQIGLQITEIEVISYEELWKIIRKIVQKTPVGDRQG